MKILIVTLITVLFALSAKAQGQTPALPSFTEQETPGWVVETDIKPEFPGGVNAFYGFINKRYRLPKVKDSMTARVYVSFVVEKDGSMSNYHILNDPGYGMADELIRVLKTIKEKWSPGVIDGKPVRASYNLPLTLNIK